MGQFDSGGAAALNRIESESLSASPAGRVLSRFLGIGSRILEVAGLHGVADLADLIQDLKNLAGEKDEANLVYFGKALVEDIHRLYELSIETRKLVDEHLKSPSFDEVLASATLHITRTNVEERIERVALLIANGIKSRDLESERLDDMMRAAVELTEWDVFVLGKMCDSQKSFMVTRYSSAEWSEQIGSLWQNWTRIFSVGEDQHLKLRSALSRLQSVGFVTEAQTHFVKDGSLATQAFGLLPDGLKFFERTREIKRSK
jgi:hypothetical protein